MKVSEEQVQNIAKLAKLSFKKEELGTFVKHFNEILEYFNKLNELDTKNVVPLYHVHDVKNVFRKDETVKSYQRDEIQKNAPETKDGFYVVPKVV